MLELPTTINGEDQLEDLLSTPPEDVVDQFSQLDGDIIVLGAGGKIGPTLTRMAKRASEQANIAKRVFAVSRFTSPSNRESLEKHGVVTFSGDLLDPAFLNYLPDAPNVFYLAAKKFGASTHAPLTWALNAKLPALVADRYRASRIVAYSSGNVYPYVRPDTGGCKEEDAPDPVGEYAQSVLARERMFEYGSRQYGTAVTLIRLNYAVEMRYGVLVDIGQKVKQGVPIDLTNGYVNLIWQGDNNAMTLRSLSLCSYPPSVLNITGPELLSVREIAEQFGRVFGAAPRYENEASDYALLSDSAKAMRLFGRPSVSVERMVQWTADWLRRDLPLLNKPTAFEVTDGKY